MTQDNDASVETLWKNPIADPFPTNALKTSYAQDGQASAPLLAYFLAVIGDSFAPAAGPGLCDLLGAALGATERLWAM